MSTFVINAHKMVQLCQVEIEADTQEEAVKQYLQKAHNGEVDVDNYSWYMLSEGDLDVENHG